MRFEKMERAFSFGVLPSKYSGRGEAEMRMPEKFFARL